MSFRLYYPIGILKLVLKFIGNYCFHIYSAPLGSKAKTFYTDANQSWCLSGKKQREKKQFPDISNQSKSVCMFTLYL